MYALFFTIRQYIMNACPFNENVCIRQKRKITLPKDVWLELSEKRGESFINM